MSHTGLRGLVAAACLVFFAAGSWAQSSSTGAIAGTVKDTSGAVLPGVTVEAASAALIEKVRSAITDNNGRVLLKAGADPRITTADGTTALMVAAGLGRYTNDYTLQRGARSRGGEQAVTLLLDAGVDVNAVNEADFTALHGAAFRGLNEIIQILVERGGNINARDYRGRTPYRIAEGSKQSFYFQGYPETTEFIKKLGANPNLGLPGNVQERLRNAATGQQ